MAGITCSTIPVTSVTTAETEPLSDKTGLDWEISGVCACGAASMDSSVSMLSMLVSVSAVSSANACSSLTDTASSFPALPAAKPMEKKPIPAHMPKNSPNTTAAASFFPNPDFSFRGFRS